MYLICVVILLVILAYVTNITSIPDSLILFQNQDLGIQPILGLKLEETVAVGADLASNIEQELRANKTKQYHLNLLGFHLKTIQNKIPYF